MDIMEKNYPIGGTLSFSDHSAVVANAAPILKFFWILFFLLISGAGFAQAEQLMQEANAAYANKTYEKAIQGYEQLLGEGYHSAVLHYNLGNAYYRTQQLGKAVLHYEKARQLAPGDDDVQHNLQVAYAAQADEMEALPAFFISKWWKGLRSQMSTNGWTITGLLLLWGAAAGFFLWLMGKRRLQRKRGFMAGLLLLLLCILPFALAISRHHYDQHSNEAILLAKEAPLHFAPDTDSQVVLTIHEGLKVDLQDRISDWYKVRLPNGEVGWLPVEVVEEI